ncbi:MAG: polysaccharide deacetylase family protein [Betaproteobacteria bacterium]|nr:polysaccharide deacetylase family protein [Betaproteobacteria bacterium]
MRRVADWLRACACVGFVAGYGVAFAQCKGTLYLTIDTGSMAHAESIADTLAKHQIKATFFLANEKTVRGDYSLSPGWDAYWQKLAAAGHTFGTHTWHHGYFRGDTGDGRTRYVHMDKKTEMLDAAGVCAELRRVESRFRDITGGKALDPIWRAPGGRTTPMALAAAKQCGYEHVHWAAAGFLGDELSSEQYPNERLVAQALKNLRSGDIMVMHTGIWSRKVPFALMLDPLLAGLKERGFCFATLPAKHESVRQ